MECPRVLFQLDSGSAFSYELGYEQVSDVDLVALVKVTREALLSLETEIEKRNINTVDTKAIRSLRDNFKTIEARERLDDAGHQFALKGIDAVKSPLSANPGTKRYQELLRDIFRLKHRGLFLLCAATFSKERIRTMMRKERLNTLIYLKANKTTFDSTILDDLAVRYGVPNYDEHLPSEARNYANQPAHKRRLIQDSNEQEPSEGSVDIRVGARSAETSQLLQHRQIEYRYSEAPVTSLSILGEDLADAVKGSSQWKWEREVSESRVTDCVTALLPKDRNLDISINLLVGFEKGTKLIEKLQLVSR